MTRSVVICIPTQSVGTRKIVAFGGNLSHFVSPAVGERLKAKFVEE